jgi:hypothetical protein
MLMLLSILSVISQGHADGAEILVLVAFLVAAAGIVVCVWQKSAVSALLFVVLACYMLAVLIT